MSDQDVAATALFFASMRVAKATARPDTIAVKKSTNLKRKRYDTVETIEMEDAEQTVPTKKVFRKQRRKEAAVPARPVELAILRIVKRHRSVVNHSYQDYSRVPATIDYQGEPTEISDMSFLQKIHHMLSQEKYAKWISWMPHGRAFRIVVPKRLEQSGTFRDYFGYSRYGAFVTQLNTHGFKHISKGEDRNCYYHESMLRGLAHLAKYMPAPKDARRLHPDPDNEPDFYKISEKFPLTDQVGQ